MIGQVWKFPLTATPEQTIQMPKHAQILCAQVQNEVPCLWAVLDPSQPCVDRKIVVQGTGWAFETANMHYIGTFQVNDGRGVFHVFENIKHLENV